MRRSRPRCSTRRRRRRHTRARHGVGTVGYMSPEQVRGAPPITRSDIFAFGAGALRNAVGPAGIHGETAADTLTAILRRTRPPFQRGSLLRPAAPGADRRPLSREEAPAARFHSARRSRLRARRAVRSLERGDGRRRSRGAVESRARRMGNRRCAAHRRGARRILGVSRCGDAAVNAGRDARAGQHAAARPDRCRRYDPRQRLRR